MVTVVKIGTESLLNFETSQKVNTMVRDISSIINEFNEKVILVTSGAVGFGKKIAPNISDKHALASIGWGALLEGYRRKFFEENVIIGGILVTHADIEDYENRRNRLIKTIEELWGHNVLPILNENDALSVEEMNQVVRGADNDKNALLIAKLFNAKNLIIVSNTNGVLKDINDKKSVISKIYSGDLSDEYINSLCGSGKSQSGTGGMSSKLNVGREAAENDIRTILCNGIDSTIKEHFLNLANGGTEILKK